VNSGPNGYLATTVDAFATGLVNMHLQAAAGAGRQASAGVFPSLGATDDYFRDMVFVADEDGGDTTAPTVSIAQPAANSIVFGKVALAATAWDDVGVVGVQFQVDGVNIGAEVNAAPYAITWDSAGVANGSRILTVIVRDAAGHSALASKTVTVANVSASQTLMTTQVPQTTSYSFGKGTWEAGMRIVSDVSGQMTAIRFWKSPRDTGPHTGHIWSATGQMLASVTFKNETSSGWQQQSLPTSVSVLANAVYVVSVSEGSNGGSTAYVALSSSGFATALVNGHLRAPAGNSGLYGKSGVLPASGSSNNYFRDVVFVADGGR